MPDIDVTIPDDIKAWMGRDSDQTREFIVQAKLPKPAVQVKKQFPRLQYAMPKSTIQERDQALSALFVAIGDLKPTRSKILKSAGAVVVQVTPQQLREISVIPGVKGILPNRRIAGRFGS